MWANLLQGPFIFRDCLSYLCQHRGERARLLHTVTSNCVLTADSIVPTYRKPFAAVAEGKRSEDWLGVEDDLRTLTPSFMDEIASISMAGTGPL